MSLFSGKWRVDRYEQLRDIPHLENLTMRSLTLGGAAMLMAAVLAGCASGDSHTAPSTPSLAFDRAEHNVAVHTKFVEALNFTYENPCNGEMIAFSGEAVSQETAVGTQEGLDAGSPRHFEYQSSLLATGTGPESGAVYTLNDTFHEGFNTSSASGPQAIFSARAATRVISDLPGLSWTIHFVYHVVTLPSGEFKVTRDVDSAQCKA